MKGRLESNTRGSLILFSDLANDTEQRISLLGDEPQKRFLEARLLFLCCIRGIRMPSPCRLMRVNAREVQTAST